MKNIRQILDINEIL